MLAGIASEFLVNADGNQFRIDLLESHKHLLVAAFPSRSMRRAAAKAARPSG